MCDLRHSSKKAYESQGEQKVRIMQHSSPVIVWKLWETRMTQTVQFDLA